MINIDYLKTKKKYLTFLDIEKRPTLNLKNKQPISGQILHILFDKEVTNFDVMDFIKVSKKQRSNIVERQIKDIFQYSYSGICISHKKDSNLTNTSFLVRNVFDRFPYELNVPYYSPVVVNISCSLYRPKIKSLIHSKYYYLRNKPLPLSDVSFLYVTGMYNAGNETAESNP